MTHGLSRYTRTYLVSYMGCHRFRVVDNGHVVGQIKAILQAITRPLGAILHHYLVVVVPEPFQGVCH